MRNARPTSVKSVLKNQRFHQLTYKTQQIKIANNAFLNATPDFLHEFVNILNINDDLIILETQHASAKTRLHYLEADFINQLHKEGLTYLFKIEVRINPNFTKIMTND